MTIQTQWSADSSHARLARRRTPARTSAEEAFEDRSGTEAARDRAQASSAQAVLFIVRAAAGTAMPAVLIAGLDGEVVSAIAFLFADENEE
jgi:hypothetical protein